METPTFHPERILVTGIRYKDTDETGVFEHAETIYLFGDNLIRRGKGGQAVIRDAFNSQGIVTKMRPSKVDEAYLSDDLYEIISESILVDLANVAKQVHEGYYDFIHIPKDGLGTGLADMKNRAPKTFRFLSYHLHRMFGFWNPGWDGKRP